MIRAMWSAAQGMKVQSARVEGVSHNLANLNTPGYKAVQIQAADLDYRTWPGESRAPRGIWPGQMVQLGAGARTLATRRDLAEGSLMPTERPLDLAIQGDSYFRLLVAGGEEYYTRDGSFRLDGDGRLVTADGLLVLDDGGQPVAIGEAAGVEITPSGEVLALSGGEAEPLGRIGLARFENPEGLMAMGDNLFSPTVESGQAGDAWAGGARPVVRQGYLESSNSDLAREMVTALLSQRAYEFNSRTLRTLDEMWGLANDVRA